MELIGSASEDGTIETDDENLGKTRRFRIWVHACMQILNGVVLEALTFRGWKTWEGGGGAGGAEIPVCASCLSESGRQEYLPHHSSTPTHQRSRKRLGSLREWPAGPMEAATRERTSGSAPRGRG